MWCGLADGPDALAIAPGGGVKLGGIRSDYSLYTIPKRSYNLTRLNTEEVIIEGFLVE